MKFAYIFTLAGLTLAGFLANSAAAADQPAATAPDTLGTAIREYILQHPEVLVESLQRYQENQKAAGVERSRQAIAAHEADLFADPSSPATGKGGANSVTIVAFLDYRCGYCKRVEPTLMKLIESNPNVHVVFKEFPILGPDSLLAAKAALAANNQNAYLKMHERLMATSESITIETINKLAGSLGLDLMKLREDMESPAVQQAIQRNAELGAAINIGATPTFIAGGELAAGALDAAAFEKLIAKVQAGQ